MAIGNWLKGLRKRNCSDNLYDIEGWRSCHHKPVPCLSISLLPLSLLVNLPAGISERQYGIITFYLGAIAFLLPVLFIRKPAPRGYVFFLFFSSLIFIEFISLGPRPFRSGWLILSAVSAAFLIRLHAISSDVSIVICTGNREGITEGMFVDRGIGRGV